MALRLDARLPWGLPAAIGGAWLLLAVGAVTGSRALDHDAVFGSGRADWVAVGLFLLGWEVMVAAMMLPAALPAVRQLVARRFGIAAFLAGFGAVWAAFGWTALSFDSLVHRTVDALPWLTARPQLVAAALLGLVGLLQLAPLTEPCLRACRSWVPTGGDGPARRGRFVDGLHYGGLCAGCDGALMLLMFGVGRGNFAWMVAVAMVMATQRAEWVVPTIHRWIGVAALVLGLAVVVAG